MLANGRRNRVDNSEISGDEKRRYCCCMACISIDSIHIFHVSALEQQCVWKKHQAALGPILHSDFNSFEWAHQLDAIGRKRDETNERNNQWRAFQYIARHQYIMYKILFNSRQMIDSSSRIDLFSPILGTVMFVACQLVFIRLRCNLSSVERS